MNAPRFACCLLLGLSACTGSDPSVPALPAAPPQASHGAKTMDEPETPPRLAYKKAFDLARKEVTVQNATTRLESLDERIEREKEMMR